MPLVSRAGLQPLELPGAGQAPKASETGETDRKGQPMSKAGSSLLRTTMVRAADNARKQDPQFARIYYLQRTQRGKDHVGALCIVAASLAEWVWTVMRRGQPYLICDTDGRPVTTVQANAIITERWTVPPDTRARRRSKRRGRPPAARRTRRPRTRDRARWLAPAVEPDERQPLSPPRQALYSTTSMDRPGLLIRGSCGRFRPLVRIAPGPWGLSALVIRLTAWRAALLPGDRSDHGSCPAIGRRSLTSKMPPSRAAFSNRTSYRTSRGHGSRIEPHGDRRPHGACHRADRGLSLSEDG